MTRLDRFYLWLVFILPVRLIYWATVRAGAEASTGRYAETCVPDLTVVETLERL